MKNYDLTEAYIFMFILGSIIYNDPELEITQFLGEGINRLWYVHIAEFHTRKEE